MPRTSWPTQHKLNDIFVGFLSHFAYLDFFCLVGILLLFTVFVGFWRCFLVFVYLLDFIF